MNPHCVSPEGFALLMRLEGLAECDAEHEAKQALLARLEDVEDAIDRLVLTQLAQHQFDALVSFVFSIGVEAFAKSEILRDLNAGRMLEAATGFDAWRESEMAGETKVLEQLVRRRAIEKLLFLKGAGEEGLPSDVVRPQRRIPRAAPKRAHRDTTARIVKILAADPRTAHALAPPPPPVEEDDVLLLTEVVPPAAKPHPAADGPWVLALFGLVFFVAGVMAFKRDSDVLFLLFMTPGLVLLGGALWRLIAELLAAREAASAN